jgi:hypothetical protein
MQTWDQQAPIYQQLADRLAARLLDGELTEGDPMPSVRALASRYLLNRWTKTACSKPGAAWASMCAPAPVSGCARPRASAFCKTSGPRCASACAAWGSPPLI